MIKTVTLLCASVFHQLEVTGSDGHALSEAPPSLRGIYLLGHKFDVILMKSSSETLLKLWLLWHHFSVLTWGQIFLELTFSPKRFSCMWVKTETEHVYLLKISLSRDRKKLQQFITDSEILTVRSHTGWQTSEKLMYKTNGLCLEDQLYLVPNRNDFRFLDCSTHTEVFQCTVITNKCPRHHRVFFIFTNVEKFV